MKRKGTKICRFGRLHLHIMPLLVWLAVVACVVVLFRYRSARFEVLGIAQSQMHQVAATCTGRLKSLPVELFGKVNKGDTVAVIDTVLDNENLQEELAVVLAEIQHLMAGLIPTQDNLLTEASQRTTDKITAQRRFDVDIENARLRILELKALLETDRIMLEDLALEVKIVQGLLNQDAIAPYELQKAEAQYNALAKKIEENEHLLAQAEQDFEQTRERSDEFASRQEQRPSVDSALNVIHKAIKVQEQRMEQLLARRKVLVLKSPLDGMVSLIQSGLGDAVLPGVPILTITEVKPRDIVAYIRQDQSGRISERMAVELIKNSEPAQIAGSQVTYLGPTVELMPQRLWQNPNIAQWGRPILIKIPPGLKLVPGETVGIRGL